MVTQHHVDHLRVLVTDTAFIVITSGILAASKYAGYTCLAIHPMGCCLQLLPSTSRPIPTVLFSTLYLFSSIKNYKFIIPAAYFQMAARASRS